MTDLSVDEIAAYLGHCTIPSVIVEGRDDLRFLRLIERHIPTTNVMAAGCKDNVLRLYRRRAGFSCPTAFLIDSDFWIFDGVPLEYPNRDVLVHSNGYSIENDLFRDLDFDSLLLPAEQAALNIDLSLLFQWFSSCVIHRPACGTPWRDGLHKIIDAGSFTVNAMIFLTNYPPDATWERFISQYGSTLLRGKTLIAAYRRYFGAHGRHAQQNPTALLELAWSNPNGYAATLLNRLRTILT